MAFVVHRENSPREPLEIFHELVARDPSVLRKRVAFDFPRDKRHVETEMAAAGFEVESIREGAIVFRYQKVEEVLGTLSPREARVLRMRFGLCGERPYTLEEVGQKFGLTRERIRQIEGRALRRLRHPRRARQLQEYVQ